MKRSDLFREYARVIDMCEGTGVSPQKCVRSYQVGHGDSSITFPDGFNPGFTDAPNNYEFALAILEGKPVFKGDGIYHKATGIKWIVGYGADLSEGFAQQFTWTKPRTFTLNGEMLPCPQIQGDYELQIHRSYFYFDSVLDRNDVVTALEKLLTNAKNS